MSRHRATPRHPLVPFLVCIGVASTAVLATAGPASAAAKAPPWRWAQVSDSMSVPADSTATKTLPCPTGFTPLAAGFSAPNSEFYLVDQTADGTHSGYSFTVGDKDNDQNGATGQVFVYEWCASTADTGTITTVTSTFGQNALTKRSGGVASCPSGTGVAGGSAHWGSSGGRQIDFSGPTQAADGTQGWFASGYSALGGDSLTVEVRCLSLSVLGSSSFTSATQHEAANGSPTLTAGCGDEGVLTGGAYFRPTGYTTFDTTSFFGHEWSSWPSARGVWTTKAVSSQSADLTVAVVCVPLSTPTVSFTSTPSDPSNKTNDTFTVAASDPSGEAVTTTCLLDHGAGVACSPGSPATLTGLTAGAHVLDVTATNVDGKQASAEYSWHVDTTAPTVTSHSPTSSVNVQNAEFDVQFSEAVNGVSTSTFKVFAGDSTTPLPGTVTKYPTQNSVEASWTARDALLPGQYYTAKLTGGIHDLAGNALVTVTWQVRGNVVVESGTPALRESWDPDKSSLASGRGYISSSTANSWAGDNVKVAAGQTVTLWGMAGPDGGKAAILVDGNQVATKSLYASTRKRVALWKSSSLPAGMHSITAYVLGSKESASKGTWVGLDSITVGSTAYQEKDFTQSFSGVSDPAASGSFYSVVGHATRNDTGGAPSYQCAFRGTSVDLYAVKTANSGSAAVYVDGSKLATVDLQADPTTYGSLVFSKALPDGVHHIRVVPLGTPGGNHSDVDVDRLVIG